MSEKLSNSESSKNGLTLKKLSKFVMDILFAPFRAPKP